MADWTAYAGGLLTTLIIVLAIIVGAGLIAGGFWLYFNWKKYREFKCIVWDRDTSGNLVEGYDTAGIFVDRKTMNKRLFLKKNNVGLNPDNIPYIVSGRKKIIYLLKTGLKNFHYIKPIVHNPNITLTVGEEDVNWAANAYERQKRLFQQNWLDKYLPFMMLAFVSIIILVMFIYFFKDFTVLKDVAVALKEASQIQHGTVIS